MEAAITGKLELCWASLYLFSVQYCFTCSVFNLIFRMLENIIATSLHRISVLALFCFVFETGPHHVAKADLELLVLSYLSSKIAETSQSHHSFGGFF